MCDGISAAMLVIGVAGAAVSGVSSYQQGQAAKRSADAQRQQAEAQASESERQARIENERAAIAQTQGEQEAAKRSRLLAADIGAAYAAYAGNGLLVDGATGADTLGSVLRTQVSEGQADISTIRDNTALSVWEHQSNASSLLASAENARIYGRNMSTVGRMQSRAGTLGAAGSAISGVASAVGGAAALHNSIGGKTILGYNVPR